MPWKQIDIKDIPNLKKGETLQIGSVIQKEMKIFKLKIIVIF